MNMTTLWQPKNMSVKILARWIRKDGSGAVTAAAFGAKARMPKMTASDKRECRASMPKSACRKTRMQSRTTTPTMLLSFWNTAPYAMTNTMQKATVIKTLNR